MAFTLNTPITLKDFRATMQECSQETWAILQLEGVAPATGRSSVREYGPEGGWVIHRENGQYFVHAWWYAPIGYDDLNIAEAKLHQWYNEFV